MSPTFTVAQLNRVRSVKQRLENTAGKLNLRLSDLQVLYHQERLLARLTQSPQGSRFVLKGGLYLYARSLKEPQGALRPTRDVDLLARGLSSDLQTLLDIFRPIVAVDLDDGILFDLNSLKAARIKEGMDYEGVRITVTGYMNRSREHLQIDIGYGDPVTPRPVPFSFPSLLNEDFELQAYNLETVIAEKFQAMVHLGEANTRYKDFFDLYTLAQQHNFKGSDLQQALQVTFKHRNTALSEASQVFSTHFKTHPIKSQQWEVYLKRIGAKVLSFSDLLDFLEALLMPVVVQGMHNRIWNPSEGQWTQEPESLEP